MANVFMTGATGFLGRNLAGIGAARPSLNRPRPGGCRGLGGGPPFHLGERARPSAVDEGIHRGALRSGSGDPRCGPECDHRAALVHPGTSPPLALLVVPMYWLIGVLPATRESLLAF